MIREFFYKVSGQTQTERSLVFHLQADITDENLADQYQGFVKPLKLYINEKMRDLRGEIKKENQFLTKHVDLQTIRTEMNSKLTTLTKMMEEIIKNQ